MLDSLHLLYALFEPLGVMLVAMVAGMSLTALVLGTRDGLRALAASIRAHRGAK